MPPNAIKYLCTRLYPADYRQRQTHLHPKRERDEHTEGRLGRYTIKGYRIGPKFKRSYLSVYYFIVDPLRSERDSLREKDDKLGLLALQFFSPSFARTRSRHDILCRVKEMEVLSSYDYEVVTKDQLRVNNERFCTIIGSIVEYYCTVDLVD